MRKLKLQIQISVDGFVAGPNGELDWMTWDWDEGIKKYVNDLHESIDTILLGRKMTDGFISHWTSVVDKHDQSSIELKESYEFAKKMIDIPKVVFTKTLDKSIWKNTSLAKGNIVDEIKILKNQKGNDVIVYGGAGFVSSLIKDNLIDEYHLFINPTIIGKGMEIFTDIGDKMKLNLNNSKAFKCGIVVNVYKIK